MLWKKPGLGDVVFNPLTTPLPTRLGSRQGRRDTNSTTDLALVPPKIALWLCSETLTPHTSDHLPMVFRLKKYLKNEEEEEELKKKMHQKQNIKPPKPSSSSRQHRSQKKLNGHESKRNGHSSGNSPTMVLNNRTKTTPDLEDINGTRLKSNEEKG